MRGPRELFEHEDHWATRMGKWFPGERTVFRGRDLHRAFASRQWMELYVYSITGRDFTPNQIELLNSMWVYTSYPDPRLWNNRVAALAGTARSTGTLGLSAALAVSEATVYGRRPDIRAISFLRRASRAISEGETLAELVDRELRRFRALPGYGRPVVDEDERIFHLRDRARELELDGGRYVALAFEVENHLRLTRRRLYMNYTALTAAICADMGFSPEEYYLVAYPVFLSGMIPCWLEANQRGEGTFLPISCRRVAYRGPGQRPWCSGGDPL
ncbi:citrate synthase [bacterium BMS3Bbin12]|nr:citrate synthase [bacterium BMS3Bbin12]GBE50038.1 citrate synthase [bacterium BMS3Bbin13]